MFDLTAHLQSQRRRVAALAIKTAAKEIHQCTDTDKKWQAMILLRQMQAKAQVFS